VVTWHNGSTTRFGHCAHENDIYQYQGAEYLFIGLDELTHFTLKQWQFLTSRNRCPVPGTFPNMAGATNPGNIGHAWVKALWIDRRAPAGMERADNYNPADYEFTKATVADNPIYADDKEYRRTLDSLPSHLRRAFLEGDWNVFAGQYFDVFNRERHVVRLGPSFGCHPPSLSCHPERSEGSVSHAADRATSATSALPSHRSFVAQNAPQDDNVRRRVGGCPIESASNVISLEPWWTRWISIDWGFEHPSAVLWHAAAPDGCVITYREFVQNRLSPRMLAAAIAERCAGERIGATYLSPDAFAQRSADDTIAEQLARGLEMEGLPRPDPADNDRVGGWMLMYEMLREDAWFITQNCEQLIESLPTLTRDEDNIEDVLKCAGDDVADAARYGIKSRLDPRHSPHAGFAAQLARRGERITAEDPTSRAIWMRQVEADARKKQFGVAAPRRWRLF
jgi:hypothetical protein